MECSSRWEKYFLPGYVLAFSVFSTQAYVSLELTKNFLIRLSFSHSICQLIDLKLSELAITELLSAITKLLSTHARDIG